MKIKVRVYRGDELIEVVERAVQVNRVFQKWTIRYKGKYLQVFGGGNQPYSINLPVTHNA
jgi:hypothetical protein